MDARTVLNKVGPYAKEQGIEGFTILNHPSKKVAFMGVVNGHIGCYQLDVTLADIKNDDFLNSVKETAVEGIKNSAEYRFYNIFKASAFRYEQPVEVS